MMLAFFLTAEDVEVLGDYIELLPDERQDALCAALEAIDEIIREFNGKVAQA